MALTASDLGCALGADENLYNDISRHSSGTRVAEIVKWPAPSIDALATYVTERSAELDAIDVALLSVGLAAPFENRSEDLDNWFSNPLADTFAVLKRHNVFIIVLNGSTFDPDESSSSSAKDARPSLMVHRLDAALIELSVLDGVSIVDVDRLVAEMGGSDAVLGLLSYTPECGTVIRTEILRILEDSRFFAAGPTVVQVGRRRDTSEI